jgi:hypothetical protein
MTVDNLATIFAPTLFRDANSSTITNQFNKKSKKESKNNSGGSQEDLLNAAKSNMELKITLVKLLIENAERIG